MTDPRRKLDERLRQLKVSDQVAYVLEKLWYPVKTPSKSHMVAVHAALLDARRTRYDDRTYVRWSERILREDPYASADAVATSMIYFWAQEHGPLKESEVANEPDGGWSLDTIDKALRIGAERREERRKAHNEALEKMGHLHFEEDPDNPGWGIGWFRYGDEVVAFRRMTNGYTEYPYASMKVSTILELATKLRSAT